MSDRLNEIRARLDAATPGPWRYAPNPLGGIVDSDGRYIIAPYCGYGDERDMPDVLLIAHAPADIAWLLNEVERLRRDESVVQGVTKWQGGDA